MPLSIFIKRLFYYLKKHILVLIAASIFMVFATTFEALMPEALGRVVDNLFTDLGKEDAWYYSSMIFIVILLSAFFAFIARTTSSWVTNKVIMSIRVDMFYVLLKLPKIYFDRNNSGNIISKLTFDVEQIADVSSTMWLNFIKAIFSVIFLSIYLLWINWQLSLSLVVILPLIAYIIHLSGNSIKKSSTILQQSMGDITHHLNEHILSNVVVKIYQTYKFSYKKFNKFVDTIRNRRFKVDSITALNIFLAQTLIGISLASVVYFSTTYFHMTSGEFISFFSAMAMLVRPTHNLVNINKSLQKALASGESVFGLIDSKVEKLNSGIDLAIKGDIEFKNVYFSYDDKLVLDNVSFNINHGETVALVGSTGSGKSTIVQLIAHFYNVDKGSILIDNNNITDINLNILRKNIAFVEQKTTLFSRSIYDNIVLGVTLDKKKIIQAIKIANAEFIFDRENGLNSSVGSAGVALSGGQAQRISIARAIAKDAQILILDEATSSLDSKTERDIQDAIEKLQQDKTTIIIAHRLNTILNADKIIVFKDGKIVESGTHSELLANHAEYCKLYNYQFRH